MCSLTAFYPTPVNPSEPVTSRACESGRPMGEMNWEVKLFPLEHSLIPPRLAAAFDISLPTTSAMGNVESGVKRPRAFGPVPTSQNLLAKPHPQQLPQPPQERMASDVVRGNKQVGQDVPLAGQGVNGPKMPQGLPPGYTGLLGQAAPPYLQMPTAPFGQNFPFGAQAQQLLPYLNSLSSSAAHSGSCGVPLAQGMFPYPPSMYPGPVDYTQMPSMAAPPGEKTQTHLTSAGAVGTANEDDLGDDNQARALKRPRLVWTPQLHKRFEEAVRKLGIEKAVPKTIMQVMNVDGLTRENVASHLQKFRLQLKKDEDKGSDSAQNDPQQASTMGGAGTGPGQGAGEGADHHSSDGRSNANGRSDGNGMGASAVGATYLGRDGNSGEGDAA